MRNTKLLNTVEFGSISTWLTLRGYYLILCCLLQKELIAAVLQQKAPFRKTGGSVDFVDILQS